MCLVPYTDSSERIRTNIYGYVAPNLKIMKSEKGTDRKGGRQKGPLIKKHQCVLVLPTYGRRKFYVKVVVSIETLRLYAYKQNFSTVLVNYEFEHLLY